MDKAIASTSEQPSKEGVPAAREERVSGGWDRFEVDERKVCTNLPFSFESIDDLFSSIRNRQLQHDRCVNGTLVRRMIWVETAKRTVNGIEVIGIGTGNENIRRIHEMLIVWSGGNEHQTLVIQFHHVILCDINENKNVDGFNELSFLPHLQHANSIRKRTNHRSDCSTICSEKLKLFLVCIGYR